MKSFSEIIREERTNYDSESLLKSEISAYINKVNKTLPQNIQELIKLTETYNLTKAEDLELIRNANKSNFSTIASKLGLTEQIIDMLHAKLRQASRYIKLLPQYQSKAEREAIKAGQLSMDDLTIDLKSSTGRNAAAKMYTPLVLKIASQYIGKSRLDKPSLISAGMEGLVDAMNDWNPLGVNVQDKEGEPEKVKKVAFKTYAAYRIQQAILNDINKNGHSLSGTNWYATDKYGAAALDAISLDGLTKDKDDDDFQQDHLLALGEEPDCFGHDPAKEEESWKNVFELMDKTFSKRDCEIFYRYFGLGPYHGKRQKSKDIAKEFGMSEGNIRNSIINKILKFLKTNPKAISMMADLKDMYTESLMMELINMSKDDIREALYNDNIYVMLEEITRWDSKSIMIQTIDNAMRNLTENNKTFIKNCLIKDSDYIDEHIAYSRKIAQEFLAEAYPVENMSRKSNIELVDYLLEMNAAVKNLGVTL